MMYYEDDDEKLGVLNDYDLAAVMEPGARFPDQSGWEKTGTIPFMAIDLLGYPNGELKRFYRYELESSAWCLTYHMLRIRPSRWLSHDFEVVAYAKGSCYMSVSSTSFKSEWNPYVKVLRLWLKDLLHLQISRADEVLNGEGKDEEMFKKELDMKVEDASYIRAATSLAKGVKTVEEIEVLRDTSWIDVVPIKHD